MMTRRRCLRLEALEDRRLLNVSPLGEAFAVNSYTSGPQQTFGQCRSAAVAMDADGDFVTVWASRDQDASDWGVFGQRFDSTGSAQGEEFQVNTATTQSQTFPSVAMDPNGDFVVTWSSLNQDHGLYGVYAQRFDAAGTPQGDEFRVNTQISDNQNFSAVAMDSDGDFVITWTSSNQDGDRTGIFAQRYDALGTALGDEIQVNSTTAGNQRYSTVGMDSAGNFVVTWTSDGVDGSSGGIVGRRFGADGTAFGDEFLVNTVTAGNQQFSSIDVAPAGDFVVAWQGFDGQASTWNVHAQLFDSVATPQGNELLVGQGKYPSVVIGSSLDFVVTSETYDSGSTDPVEISARHYDQAGTSLGDGLLLDNGPGDQLGPTAAGNGDVLAIVWTSDTQGSTEEDVSAQLVEITPGVGTNLPPIVSEIADATVDEGQTLSFTASATDPDDPMGAVTFSLNPGSPAGASIDPVSGFFTWTPLEADGPDSYAITVRATDEGTPALTGTATFEVTVNEVNRSPVIDPVVDQSIEELHLLEFVVTASDPDYPDNELTFVLGPNAPEGAQIDSATGQFTWTPTEEQGPGEFHFTVMVTDDATPELSDFTSISITVTEGNSPPVLDAISSHVVDLEQTLSFSVTATDPDHPPDTLSFSLDAGAPEGAWIDPSSGQFAWTPGPDVDTRDYNVTVRVTDNGTPAADDSETFSITVETDMMDPIDDQTINEGELLTFLLSATHPTDPGAELFFSLDPGAPSGAAIDVQTGEFTWTPDEAQGPGVHEITVRVSDNGTDDLTDSERFSVTVNEVNQSPTVEAIDDISVNEGETVEFTVVASDDDQPDNLLTFSLDPGAPAEAVIDPQTGRFSWTPDEAEGPLDHEITVRVTDDGNPALDAAATFTVTVAEANRAPMIDEIEYQVFHLGETYSLLVSATDPDLPADVLTFSLDPSSPNGAAIDSASGLITWTPSVEQGPGIYRFTVGVSDDGDPQLSDSHSFDVALETAMLDAIGDQVVDEGNTLSLTATATHPSNPSAELIFSLEEFAPAGAAIDPASGLFTWTPTEEQGPGTYSVIVRVSDNNVPAIRDSTAFSVVVAEVNLPPVVDAVEDQTLNEGDTLTLTVTATDPDLPVGELSFSLDAGAPLGAEIDADTGEFTWTPTEDQGPDTHSISVRVTDDGVPALDAVTTFSVTVEEVNLPPVLDPVGQQTIDEGETLTMTVTATDPDLPADALAFSLEPGAPAGMNLDAVSGVLSWTPSGQQGRGPYAVSVRVSDDGSPEMSDVTSFWVIVEPPMLEAIGDQSVDELTQLSFTAAATSPYDPADGLSFSLDPGAPAGATIDPASGQFSWTPTEAQGPGQYTLTVRLTDDTDMSLSDSESFAVTVGEVNSPPAIEAIEDQMVNRGDTFSITVTTVDPDLPGNTLLYSLQPGAPDGVTIDAETGLLTWATTVDDDLATYPITVVVNDSGDPALEDTETFSVTLIQVNGPPVIEEIDDFSVDEGATVLRTVVITDPDQSTESLDMGLAEGAADGATFDPATMEFTWVTDEEDGPGTYNFTIWATDDGNPALSDAMTFAVTVVEVNQAPTIQTVDDMAVDRGTRLTFYVEVDDPDVPVNTLTFSLDAGAPAGAEIDPATGLFNWMLDESVAFDTYDITVRVVDDGSPTQESTETFSVTVERPMLEAIDDRTVDEWTELALTAVATDPYDPDDGYSFSLDASSLQLGAQIEPDTGLFTWTPTEDQGPGVHRITVLLTDDSDSAINDSESFWVTVNEVSDNLMLSPIADVTLLAGAPLHVPLNASGSYPNSLSYSVSTLGEDIGALISETNRSLQISVQNTGQMTFELFEDLVPQTTARIVELAQEGFYDGLIFHRVASYQDGSPFVIQTGDPNGDGSGGSGVSFDDEFHPDLRHTSAGILSMANHGDDTNDSQFFVTAGEARFLDYDHAVFGVLSSGDEVRRTIQDVEVDANSKPLSDVIVNSISVFVDDRNGVLTLSAPTGASGEADVTVTVDDGLGGFDSLTFHVTIEPDSGPDSNAHPYLLPLSEIETTTNTPVEFTIPAVDLEGDQIYYYGSVDPAVSGLTLDVLELNGRATLTQTVPLAGVYSLRLGVGAVAGHAQDSQLVPVFIRPAAPAEIRLAASSDTGLDNSDGITRLDNSADNLLEVIVAGTVPGALVTLFADGEQLGQAVADGMSVTILTNGTYLLADGTHSLTAVQTLLDLPVDVGNRHETVDLISDTSAPFEISVDTDPPLFTSAPVTTADEGVAYTYDADTDAEVGSGAGYSLTDSPDGMQIDPLSGLVSWLPLPSQGPTEFVSIRASDLAGNTADQAFTVILTDMNQPPVLGEILDQTVAEGNTLSFTASATDPDIPADTLSYSLDAGFPSGAQINATSGLFSWTPDESQGPNAYTITVRVTDDGTPALSDTETFLVTVTEGNQAPVLAQISDQTVAEGDTVSFTASAADPDIPANTLGYSLEAGFPSGAQINATNGLFSWTPDESQGPNTYSITVRVTDDGTPALSDTETFLVTVTEGNQAPVLAQISDQTVTEGNTLSFTASATDLDIPADTLSYSLDAGFPSGAQINPSSGLFSWTPDESQGPDTYSITVRVTDDGTPALSDTETFLVTVTEGNQAPVLAQLSDQTVAEGDTLSFTASATDPDIPADTLSYSLDAGFPSGAQINPSSGLFSWTPGESHGPDTHTITVRATDDGTPALSDTETFIVTVTEENQAPVLAQISDQTVADGDLLSFTATATDPDIPANTLSYSLDAGFPSGAQINATSGLFSWTPDELQGPNTYTITVRVTDDGTPALSDTETFLVTVTEGNQAPVLGQISDQTVAEWDTVSFTANAIDPDIPANTLSYSLDAGFPGGAYINATSGLFSWTPDESQGPDTYSITVRVTDDGTPAFSDTETFLVTVTEWNRPPVLAQLSDQTVAEGALLSFTAGATDSDIPANTLSYSLDAGFPSGAQVNATSGLFSWTPDELQGPNTYSITVRVTDDGTPALSDTETFLVTVTEWNQAPVLAQISDQTVAEGDTLSFTAGATDSDIPANTLSYSLDAGFPSGAQVNATSGLFSWTPDELQGPNTYSITVRVTDNGTPALSDTETFIVTVTEENQAPVLAQISDQTVAEGALLSFTASATDPDIPANTLSYSLDVGFPSGAQINATSGLFSWTPDESQGPDTYSITVRVTDDGTPALSDTETFLVTVTEENQAPVLAQISDQTVTEGDLLSFTAGATDPDIPANTLSYSLDAGFPSGAQINASSGLFSWTPGEPQGPNTYAITVRVTDDGTPALSDTETFTVTVTEENQAPVLAQISDQTVAEGDTLSFTAGATDPDIPANTLSYSLDAGFPSGAQINASSGLFSWTPDELQGPDTYSITVRVTDDGTPAFSDTETFTVTVTEENQAPVLAQISDQTVAEGDTLSFTAGATDSDIPANTLSYSLDAGFPSGAQINPTSGLFSWTPDESQGPDTYTITVRVTDDGTPALSDTETFIVTVTEENQAPALESIPDWMVAHNDTLSFTASATDPGDQVTFSLDSPVPPGAAIDPDTGVFTWTPTPDITVGWHQITVRATDDGSPGLSDSTTANIKLMGRTPLGSIDLATLESLDLPSYTVESEARFSLLPIRTGRVTFEATYESAMGELDLVLLDSSGEVVATSEPISNGRRIETVATGGQTYELVASGSNPTVVFQGANLLVDRGSTLDVFGTGDDDTFEIVAGSFHLLTANGLSYTVDPALTETIMVYGATGDSVVFTGTAAGETATLSPASAVLAGSGYTFEASGADSITINGGGGFDVASLYDSTGDDTFEASPGTGDMSGPGFANRVEDFDEVHGYSRNGVDVANLSDSPSDDEFIGKQDYSKLFGEDFFLRAKSFDRVYADASAGGTDTASLVDGDGDDTFVANPTETTMTGEAHFLSAGHFDFVHGYAREGGVDTAHLYDSSGDDTFKATPEYGKMIGEGFYNRAKFFEYTHGVANAGGHDTARLYDSTGNDTLIATPTYAKLFSDGFFLRAKLFEEVQIRASNGGDDAAQLRDSTGDDLLEADENRARLYNAQLDFMLDVIAFGQVNALSGSGDHDIATIAPAVDFLMLEGDWEERP